MSLGRKPQQASDYRSVTVLRDGGGDFPSLNSALEYLAGSGFTPSGTDFFTIELGAGTFSVDNSAGAIALPEFVSIIGEAEALTNIVGTTPANPLFTCANLYLARVAIGGCTVAVNHNANGTVYIRDVEFNGFLGGTTLFQTDRGLNFIQRCTAQGFVGPVIDVTGAVSAMAIVNLQTFIPQNNATVIRISDPGANTSIFNCVFDAVTATGVIGLDLEDGVIESQNNRFRNLEKAIVIADDATLEFESNTDSMTGCTTDIEIEGASGTNSATYSFSNLVADHDKFVLNDNVPPKNYVDLDGHAFSANSLETITTNTTLSFVHRHIICTGTIDITLPDAATYQDWEFVVVNVGAGTITLVGTLSGTVDRTIPTQYTGYRIQSDGTAWYIIGKIEP